MSITFIPQGEIELTPEQASRARMLSARIFLAGRARQTAGIEQAQRDLLALMCAVSGWPVQCVSANGKLMAGDPRGAAIVANFDTASGDVLILTR